ncbi:MAG: hypothetical protein H7Z15_18800 [Rhizobacter sp.]|nr:hypothetical protein [Rhizobacter sp.]
MSNRLTDSPVTPLSIEHILVAPEVQRVECSAADYSSVARGKVVSKHDFVDQQGCRLPSVVFGLTLTGTESPEVFGRILPKSYRDVHMVPDMTTYVAPSILGAAASVICEPSGALASPLYGSEVDASEFSARVALRKAIKRLSSLGLTATVAPELEFYLLRNEKSSPNGASRLEAAVAKNSYACERACEAYSLERTSHFSAFFDELLRACEGARIPVTGFSHESAYSQYEVNFAPGAPLAQADAVFRFKRLARQIAARQGFLASFIPKPFLAQPGCGMHWHFSLQGQDGTNAFAGIGGPSDVSKTLLHFIAGLQRDAAAAMAFFAPYDMSYDRIRRSDASPSIANWGFDDRSVAFRIPASSAKNRRVENRLPGGDASPYLTVAATLGLGTLGIEESLPCGEAGGGGGWTDSKRLPRSMTEAVSLLDESIRMRQLFGDPLVDLYCAIKRKESEERNATSEARNQWDMVHLLEQA